VPGLRRPVGPLADLAALGRIRALIRELRPDVLLTTGSKAGVLGASPARRIVPRPRTVHVFHGHVFRGHFSGPAGWAFARVERSLAGITDDVVAVCGSVADDLRDLGLDRGTRLHTVEIGYDLSPLLALGPPAGALAAELGLPETTPLVVYPARICPVKNQSLAVEAWVWRVRPFRGRERSFSSSATGRGARLSSEGANARRRRPRAVPRYREEMAPGLPGRMARGAGLPQRGDPDEPHRGLRLGPVLRGDRRRRGARALSRGVGAARCGGRRPGAGARHRRDAGGGRPEAGAVLLRREVVARFSPARFADEMERIILGGASRPEYGASRGGRG